jgi:hypothetical protein
MSKPSECRWSFNKAISRRVTAEATPGEIPRSIERGEIRP